MALPEGYYVDQRSDPGLVYLCRPDGSLVAVFSAWGVVTETIERAAQEDANNVRRKVSAGPDKAKVRDTRSARCRSKSNA